VVGPSNAGRDTPTHGPCAMSSPRVFQAGFHDPVAGYWVEPPWKHRAE
jgi:hypothetical protein